MPLAQTIRNEDHATFAFAGSWTTVPTSGLWGTTPTTPTSSGTCKFSGTVGDTCTITLPANHGFTSGAIIGYGANTANANASIAVDGVLNQVWRQKYGVTADSHYFLPRLLSAPFVLNPAKGTTQIIVITVGNGGGNLIIDGMELFTASAPVAGRIVRSGMSMEYPVIDGGTLGPNTQGHGQRFVAYLTATKYLGNAVWTDVNQAVPAEDFANGSTSSGTAGGPNSAPAYPQFTNQAFQDNAQILTPGWMRTESGAAWPSPAPRLGGALFTTNTQYMAGVPQWHAQLGQYYLFFHNHNDGYQPYYDDPLDDVTTNGASALKTIATLTVATGTPSGGSMTVTDGAHPVAFAPTATLTTIQAAITAAGLPVVATSNVTAGNPQLVAVANQIAFTAITRGTLVLSLSANTVTGGTVAFATTQVGRPKIAAGAGFVIDRFIARMRADLARLAMAITPCPRVAVLGFPNNINGAPMTNPAHLAFDQPMRALLTEPWIPALTGGYPFYFVPLMATMTGHSCSISDSDVHQNNVGHDDIYNALVRAHESTLATAATPTGAYRS